MNDAFSPHTYQLLYRCRVNFSSSTTFDKNVLNIDRGFKLHLRGVRGGEPGGPRPSPVALATPTARGGGSKGRSYIYLISFDPYRTPVPGTYLLQQTLLYKALLSNKYNDLVVECSVVKRYRSFT